MTWRALKYLLAYSLPLSVVVSFLTEGIWAFVPLFYSFGLIPLAELLLRPDPRNLSAAQAEVVREDPLYDWLLYLLVPIQYGFLFWFLYSVSSADDLLTILGRVSAMGLLCGVIGINVGHELGHRPQKRIQRLAQLLLASSLYAHFFVEHNYGHHRNVGTAEDPATARRGESLYAFWWRSITRSYLHAWQIQRQLLQARKKAFWSAANLMLRFHIGQGLLLLLVFLLFGLTGLLAFFGAAFFGILLLETVNYIEHYGLRREKVSAKRYEKTNPSHSWNSDHLLGRWVLFELSRHSDHHAHPHKKYALLEHWDESPQLPTGYPGMMLLASLPPLWFALVNPKLERQEPLAVK